MRDTDDDDDVEVNTSNKQGEKKENNSCIDHRSAIVLYQPHL